MPAEVDRMKQLLVEAAPKAGDYYTFKVPITASADSGANWSATH